MTALHVLLLNWKLDHSARLACFELLRAAGADVNIATTGTRCTPLHIMALDCRPEAVSLLLEAGANVDAVAMRSTTPLHFAVVGLRTAEMHDDTDPSEYPTKRQISQTVSLLLKAGASVDTRTRRGDDRLMTPLELAMETKCRCAYPLLLRSGATIPQNTDPYLSKVLANGGFAAYRRRHLDRLALMFTAPPVQNDGRRRSRRRVTNRLGSLERLPPEIIRRVVEFWAHVGHY